MNDFFRQAIEFLSRPLVRLGTTHVSVASVVMVILGAIFVVLVARGVRSILVKRVLVRYHHLDRGVADAIATIIKYIILAVGFFILIEAVGIDLSGLGVLVGALGVGIGFGLQNITNNFISGVIILFERPIKVGDRIEVGTISGDVIKISARATTILTNDNITLIVPNSEFVSGTVTNWTNNDSLVAFRLDVGVSHNEDPENIRMLLMEVAAANKAVLSRPEPQVLFDSYGDSALNFKLRVWTTELTHRPFILKSQLYYEIFEKFKQHGVEIPFPQRDIHIRSEHAKRHIFEQAKTDDEPEGARQ